MSRKLNVLLIVAVLASGCTGALAGGTINLHEPPPTTPIPPVVFDVVVCAAPPVQDRCDAPIAGAVVQAHLSDGTYAPHAGPTNADGYVLFTVAGPLPDSDVIVDAPGYVQGRAHIDTAAPGHHFVVLESAHVDPSNLPLGQVAAIRGAMWPQGLGLPFGPRPGAADNIIATDFLACYSPEQQLAIVHELHDVRGYTHAVVGPIVDSDGYHGQYCVHDWRTQWDAFLDVLQFLWDHGLTPVVFGHPDGWTFEQTRDELTPLLQQPRAQRLIRIFVPTGWEPTRYGWSSCTWAAFAQWARTTLPNALVLIHTEADVDAPAGTDDRCNDDDHAWNPSGNAGAWSRVAPFIHGWLVQNNAFDCPTCTDSSGKTNFQNFQDQFNPSVRGSLKDRFVNGYAGWPQGSAWGADMPLLVYAGEYRSFWTYWKARPEAEGVSWGDAAIAAGADGYLDGGSVAVPVRR